MADILYKQESYEVMGACFEVYKEKGVGFLEPVYHECLEIEFRLRGIPAVHHPGLALEYKGHALKRNYEADFVAFSKILIEVKAVKGLADEHRAQVINYLKSTGFKLGLLVNFGKPGGLEWERLVLADWLRDKYAAPNLRS